MTTGYIVRQDAFISSLLPIIEKIPGKTFVQPHVHHNIIPGEKVIFEGLEDLKVKLQQNKITHLIIGNSIDTKKLGDYKTIQVFHGVSNKDMRSYGNKDYDHVLISSDIILYQWMKYCGGENVIMTNFIRYNLYNSKRYKNNILYMPTHSDQKQDSLYMINQICLLPYNVTIKFHPNTFKTNRHLIKYVEYNFPFVKLIKPDMDEYFKYETIYNNNGLLISDHSSSVYEWTLTKKPILLLPDRYGEYLELPKAIKYSGDLEKDVAYAINRKPRYPKIFYDRGDPIKVIKELL